MNRKEENFSLVLLRGLADGFAKAYKTPSDKASMSNDVDYRWVMYCRSRMQAKVFLWTLLMEEAGNPVPTPWGFRLNPIGNKVNSESLWRFLRDKCGLWDTADAVLDAESSRCADAVNSATENDGGEGETGRLESVVLCDACMCLFLLRNRDATEDGLSMMRTKLSDMPAKKKRLMLERADLLLRQLSLESFRPAFDAYVGLVVKDTERQMAELGLLAKSVGRMKWKCPSFVLKK